MLFKSDHPRRAIIIAFKTENFKNRNDVAHKKGPPNVIGRLKAHYVMMSHLTNNICVKDGTCSMLYAICKVKSQNDEM